MVSGGCNDQVLCFLKVCENRFVSKRNLGISEKPHTLQYIIWELYFGVFLIMYSNQVI